jgi:t-SNARE complex subunit (syntaxin)
VAHTLEQAQQPGKQVNQGVESTLLINRRAKRPGALFMIVIVIVIVIIIGARARTN